MKALSLWQPWASLLVHGAKRVETRSWPLRHRGPLLIHAAKKWTAELERICDREPFASALDACLATSDSWRPKTGLPFGAVVGRVNVIECYPTSRVELDDEVVGASGVSLLVTPTQMAFGDYSPGRFAFLCANPVAFEKPIPRGGARGLFDVPDGLLPAHDSREGQ